MRIAYTSNQHAAAATRPRSASALDVSAFVTIAIVPVVAFPVTGGLRLE